MFNKDTGMVVALLGIAATIGFIFVFNGGIGGSNNIGGQTIHVSTIAPTVNDDYLRGFAPGDIWVNQDGVDFYGAITNAAGLADWDILNATGGSGGHIIQDEGSDLPAQINLTFNGAGVACTDDTPTDATLCTIPGGGAQNLAGVLSTGNTSGGTDISLSGSGDTLIFVRSNTLTVDALTQTSGAGIAQIPDLVGGTDQLVLEDVVQILTNKTINDFTNNISADEVHVQLRNETGSTINEGDIVYISGFSVGQSLPLVTLADASSSSTMPAFAMLENSSLSNNATGDFLPRHTTWVLN